jgi:hypothetical protein
VARYTITTCGGEILGETVCATPEQVTKHLLREARHRLANLGKTYTVTDPSGAEYDCEQWLWSRPAVELDGSAR